MGMIFKVNSKQTSVNGTSHKGYVETTYNTLVKVFGQPKEGSADGKTTCEWRIEFDDGVVATIYDWKTRTTPKDLYYWHIGGHTHKALDYLETLLKTNVQSAVY